MILQSKNLNYFLIKMKDAKKSLSNLFFNKKNKLKMKYFYLIVTILITLYACEQSDEKPIAKYQFKAFYYPVDALNTGKIYVYTPVNGDTSERYFSYFLNNGGYLVSTVYNAQLQIEQISTEDILRNGTALHRLRLCDYTPDKPDICQPIDVKIESSAVFPFQMMDSSGVFLYKILWKDSQDSTIENSIIRNRHFMGFEKRNWKGKTYDIAKFGIREEITVGSQIDGFQTFKAFTEEYYAKGIGLIYYKKNIDNVLRKEFELSDTTNMQQLEKMFSETINR